MDSKQDRVFFSQEEVYQPSIAIYHPKEIRYSVNLFYIILNRTLLLGRVERLFLTVFIQAIKSNTQSLLCLKSSQLESPDQPLPNQQVMKSQMRLSILGWDAGICRFWGAIVRNSCRGVALATSPLEEGADLIKNLIVNLLPLNQCRPMTPPINTVVVKARGLQEAPAENTPASERKRYHGTCVAQYYTQVHTGVHVRKTSEKEWVAKEQPSSRTWKGSWSREFPVWWDQKWGQHCQLLFHL